MTSGIVLRVARIVACLTCVTGAATAQDTYPQGTMAYFNLASCPTGWAPATGADNQVLNGVTLVPFAPPVPPNMLGTTVQTPLGNGEVRTHTHTFSSSVDLSEVEYAGIVLGDNNDTSVDGTVPFSSVTGAPQSEETAPYIQYLLCQKTAFQRNQNPPVGVPQDVVTFYGTAECPTGWKPTLVSAGRLLIGLPSGGTPQATFGGNPLAVGEDRQHTHTFSGSVWVQSTDVALASGCCAENYGAAGTYSYSGTTDPASSGFPYTIVNQCQPCVTGDQDPACQGQ
ncbi:hypothetical protein QFZ27_001755 [Inquilinus ginsengisoli]|uniref:hypothetical protein n=1 Tax=Inquilinus ginsengisoli TaxID=363840 RepID=UPI003D22761B